MLLGGVYDTFRDPETGETTDNGTDASGDRCPETA